MGMNETMKYVFVCGLHRSGTTILAREIGKLENCTAFQGTGVPMDEGQWLQNVYPVDATYGGVGRFGFAPQAHLTESSSLLTPANVTRLRESWECRWTAPEKTIRVEKTPANLIMTRFLQAAFENAYFVVIKRHPVAVSLATQKWSRTSLHSLLDHWLRCHEMFNHDVPQLKHVYELRYEDYIDDPVRHMAEIATFIGTSEPNCPMESVSDAHNQVYLSRWEWMLRSSPYRAYYRHLAGTYEASFAAHGYSVATSYQARLSAGRVPPTRRITGPALCFGADLFALWKHRRHRVRVVAAKWGNLGLRAARLLRSSLQPGM
jgi:hypothetical protein